LPKDKPLELVRIPLSQIKPDPKNAKDHDVGLIIESFRRFGYVNPMVLNSDDYLLAGHGRRKALLTMQSDNDPPPKNIEAEGSEWIVPVGIGPDFNKTEGTAYRLVDNRSTESGGYDEPQLLENLIALSKNGGLEATGYDQEDVDQLFRLLNPNIKEIDVTDEAAILQEKWGTELGQLWEVGRHRLMCGDSTDPGAVEQLLAGNTPNLMVTDPPYGVEYEGGSGNSNKRSGLQGDSSAALYAEVQIPSCVNVIYEWHADLMAEEVYAALRSHGFKIRSQIIWNKINAHYGSFMAHYLQKHEPCVYAVRQRAGWIGPSNEKSVWEIEQPSRNEHHPTEKPLECMAIPIRNHSGDVYDPFMGSGTTMVAAEQLNRTCYGMEIEPKYVAVTLERMSKLGLEPKLAED
jgi:DNA modification methylase